MKKRCYIFWLIFFISFDWFNVSILGNEFDYKIRRISPDGGLSINGQRDVCQDKWGFIWVTTVNNLYRFDGYSFDFYTNRINKSDSYRSITFERLEVDKVGDLYVTTSEGLLKYNTLTDSLDCVFPERCFLIKEDIKGRLWVSTSSSVGLLDRETFKFNVVKSKEGNILNATSICVKNDRIYWATAAGQIYLFDENQNILQKVFSSPDYNIVDIVQSDTELYVLTENSGLIVLDRYDYTMIKQYDFFYPEGDTRVSARALYMDKFNHIWITGQRGIYVLNLSDDKYIYYSYDKNDLYGLPSNSIWRIAEDAQGCLWFGTYSGGLCYINLKEKESIKSFDGKNDDLSYSVVSSFAESEDYLWIGTEGGGLNRLDKRTNRFTHLQYNFNMNSLSYDNIQSLLYVGGKLWIGMSRGGLDCLDIRTGHFVHYTTKKKMLINDHVERIVAEADSGLWIKYLMDRDFLTYFSLKSNKIEHINLRTLSLSIGDICDIRRGDGDILWLVSSSQLFKMNVRTRDVQVAEYSKNEENSNLNIQTIYVDEEKSGVWLGTHGNGLLFYDIEKRNLSLKADLFDYGVHSIYSINKDDMNNIWLGTDNGLFCLDLEMNRLQYFDKADGAQGKTYYPFSTIKLNSGKLCFGGNEGFSIIDPTKIFYNDYKPNVILTDFFINNISVSPDTLNSPLKLPIFQTKQIVLKYNQNDFSFKFASTNYLNPNKNHFRYRLKNYDDRWIETDASHRLATYSKVPKGNYCFEIMAANDNGVWGELTSVELIVKPAPWLSNWAIIMYILLSVVLLFLSLRWYNHQRHLKIQYYLESQEKEQQREFHKAQLNFFTNVSHDFRTPISLILAVLDIVKSDGLSEKYIRVLENNAKRLLLLVDEIIDFRSLQENMIKLVVQPGNWNQFVVENCSDFSEMARQKKISYVIEQDSFFAADFYFDKRVVEKILLNLLNNAFKYTPTGGNIKVSIFPNISHFKSIYTNKIIIPLVNPLIDFFGLVISDNGVGISETSITHIFERYYRVNESNGNLHLGSGIGLALVKSLVELHKGYIAVYSERGKGTDIVVGFPVDTSVYNSQSICTSSVGETLRDSFVEDFDAKKNNENFEYLPCESSMTKKHILIVEDNEELRILLGEMLKCCYLVNEAANGLKALDILKNENIDLVLTDVMMPEMTGIELSKRIKEDIDTSHIPIIMLTAKVGDENQIEGLYSGADLYLKKPVNKQILLLSLSNIFSQQERIRDYYARHYFAKTDTSDISLVNKKDADFMKRLVEVIEENLSNVEIDVLQIASALAMSRRTLYNKVKILTGQSVVEFIRNYRLRKAAQILAEEDVPISIAMERVGFDNPSYFSRTFKKEFGKTPSSFVTEQRKK